MTITGTNLDTLDKLSTGIKLKTPGAKVFCIVNLQTETSRIKDIWHTNILLGANAEEVVTHDPSDHYDVVMPFKHQSKQAFHERWAIAFNRAHLIVAA